MIDYRMEDTPFESALVCMLDNLHRKGEDIHCPACDESITNHQQRNTYAHLSVVLEKLWHARNSKS